MTTEKQAANAGWEITVDGEEGRAVKGDQILQVVSDTPTDSLLRLIDEIEHPPPPADPAVVAIAALRAVRDELLAVSDWTQLADAPLEDTDRAAWAAYRQQLRDFPAVKGLDPRASLDWPTPPA